MDLFNRKPKKVTIDLDFNAKALESQIRSLAGALVELRHDPASKAFVQYVVKLMNLEILRLSSTPALNSEAYAYRRGRIDSLRELLTVREAYISNEDNVKSKNKTDNKAKRSYFNRPKPSNAGLAI